MTNKNDTYTEPLNNAHRLPQHTCISSDASPCPSTHNSLCLAKIREVVERGGGVREIVDTKRAVFDRLSVIRLARRSRKIVCSHSILNRFHPDRAHRAQLISSYDPSYVCCTRGITRSWLRPVGLQLSFTSLQPTAVVAT